MAHKQRVFAIFVVMIALGGWIWLTFSGAMETFEQSLLLVFREAGDPATLIGPSWLLAVVTGITHIGDSIFLIFLSLGVLGWAVYRRKKLEVLALVGCVGGVFLLTPLLKNLFARARPDIVDHLVHASSASFPSGHTLRSAVVYIALFLLLQRLLAVHSLSRFLPAIVLLVAAIGSSRVVLGVHWPSDIIGGWLIASLWLLVWWPLLRPQGRET